MKTKTIILLTAVMLLFVVSCGSASNAPEQQPPEQEQVQQPAPEAPQEQPQEQTVSRAAESSLDGSQNIGEGATVFLFEATDNEGNVSTWSVHTNAATVGEALVEVGLIEGEVSDFGLMVLYVNGIRADYNEDGAYWAFYADGDFAVVGVDSTDIEEGVTYAFVYTEA